MHPVAGAEVVESGDPWRDRHGAGADDQRVVVERFLAAVGSGDDDAVGVGIDPAGGGVKPEGHAGVSEVVESAVGEVVPVADFAGDVVRDAADREVRVGVGQHDRDLGGRVEFPGPEGGADARVAAPDGHESYRHYPADAVAVIRASARGSTATAASCGVMSG